MFVPFRHRSRETVKKGIFIAGGATCHKILLPKEYSQETVNFSVEVNASDYQYRETKKLGVLTDGSEFTLIQTDKPVYKPGQAGELRW